jgi:SAM-dependent methyltransferase
MRDALQGRLPARYSPRRFELFNAMVESSIGPGTRVLDVGSGRRPIVPRDLRPDGTHYVGLDLSDSELRRAPDGEYDRIVVGDIARPIHHLAGQFDLVASYQVLEHVRPLRSAFENMRHYLRPGGRLIITFSGTFSLFGIANQLIPDRLAKWILTNLLDREPDLTFPAHYDQCWHTALERILEPWHEATITPYFTGADYLRFARPLQALYLGYEELTLRRGLDNLAAYYLVTATA